jgi:ElaB/YqjD/DUF883 family membrane-anchored ribosome-binding protein
MLSYAEFLFETYGKVKADTAKSTLLTTIAESILSNEEYDYFLALSETHRSFLLEAIDNDDYESLYENIDENVLYESWLKKAKERFDNLKDKVKEKGKEALDSMSDASKNLLKIGGNILKPIKAILEKMGAMIKKAWEKIKAGTQAAVDKALPALKKRLQNMVKDGKKKKSLIDEMKNIGKMAAAGKKLASGGWTEMIGKGAEKAAKSDEGISFASMYEYSLILAANEVIKEGYSIEKINEELADFTPDMLNEGGGGDEGLKIPFVSKIMDKIGHTPPFSWFHKIEGKVAEMANNGLERASAWIAKLDGPGPFDFHIIGGLIGVAAGYLAEQYAKGKVFSDHGAKILGFLIPGASVLYTIIKYTGYALAIYGVIKQVVGQGEKEGEEGEKKEATA